MDYKLQEIIFQICQTLNENNVQYLIIGGSAVALHGYFRMSRGPSGEPIEKLDIDIWYNPTYANYYNLLNALENLGEEVNVFRNEQAPNPLKSFFKLERDQFTLDFLPSITTNQKFRSIYKNRDQLKFNQIVVPYINIEDLILSKKAQARPKDIEDIKQLNKLKSSNKEDDTNK